MRFVCMSYADPAKFQQASEEESAARREEFFAYNEELRRAGHFVSGMALQLSSPGVTLRTAGGKVTVTDGPFAETKEHLGGILLLEARDLNQAIALMSKHPGLRWGSFEIRVADEAINAMIAARGRTVGI